MKTATLYNVYVLPRPINWINLGTKLAMYFNVFETILVDKLLVAITIFFF